MRPESSSFITKIIPLMTCGIFTEIVEALLVWGARGCVHRPQESLVRVHTKRVESMSAEMVGAVEEL